MSLIGNPDTPASYVADYMQACVGMFGIPAGGFTSDIETYGASTSYNVESLYAAMLNSTIGRSIYAPGISNESFATKLVDKVGGGLLSDADKAAAVDEVQALLDGGVSQAATAMAVVEFVAGLETSDATYGAIAQQFQNRIEIANYYTFSSTNPSSTLTTLTAILVGVDNETDVSDPAAVLEANTDPGVTTGQTYTLTTSLDSIVGTSSNDTIQGDFTSTSTFNAGDVISGGAGTDTLKMFGTYTAASAPLSVTGVEKLYIATLADANLDLSSYTKAATGIESIEIGNAALMSGKTITTTAGQSLSLATGASNAGTAGKVTWAASATDTSATLNLNGYQGGTGATAQAVDITGAATKTLNISSTGAANKITTLTVGGLTDKVVITGDKNLTVSTDLVSSGGATVLKTIDASAATGNVNITLAAATGAAFAFTGGTGNDTIKFADDEMGTLTAGSQLDGGAGTDKIGLLDTAISAAEYTALNAAKNFETLGLNAAVSVDASQLTTLKSFALDTDANATITSMKTGSSLALNADHGSAITVSGAVGVNDLALTVGTSATKGLSIGGDLTIGQTTVALQSLGDGVTAANTIAQLKNADNSVYTITGNNDLTITAVTATAIGSKYDASGLTGKLNITGNATAFSAGSSLGDVIIGGSAADTIKAAVNGGSLTGNGGNDTFDVSVAVAGANVAAGAASSTTIAITTIEDFTKGDKIDFGATAGAFTSAKVDISAAATLGAALDLLVAGNAADLKWGVWGGNTYIVDDAGAGATVGATDTVVKLTGTLDLSTSTLSATVLTFA